MLAPRPGLMHGEINVEARNLNFGGQGGMGRAQPGFERLGETPPGFERVARPQTQETFGGRTNFERVQRPTFPQYPGQGYRPYAYPADFGMGEQQQLGEAQPFDRLQSRIDQLEAQVRANTDKAAMESEIKPHATAIDPFKKRGLFAQHEILAAIYAAPEDHKAPLALSHELGVFLKNRCIKLSYMAEDLATYAQQKVREAGEKPTAAQIAQIEKDILRYFQEKRVKAEDVLAKHPEWLREEYR